MLAAAAPTLCAADAEKSWAGLRWGDTSAALAARFGSRARVLARPIDFGDSYTQVVLPHVAVGGVPVVAFFQMDKATGGLKRIQFERQRHGVNPPAFRAVVAGLDAAYGAPERECDIPPAPASGWQAATELTWRRGGNLIRAIFRDTTIEAFEGCLFGDPTLGPCGLTGQLLVRISPPGSDRSQCLPSLPVTEGGLIERVLSFGNASPPRKRGVQGSFSSVAVDFPHARE